MTATPVEPADIDFDERGQAFSRRYGDVYASRDGALGQARHVFLGGNGLPQRWARRGQFVVVETGFGLGVNFLATWQAWRDDPLRPRRLHFVSIERHPPRAGDLRRAPPPLGTLAEELAARWPLPLPGLHRLEFDDGAVVLTLAFGDAAALAPKLALGADAFYLDGFAPDRNPDMWSPPLLKSLARLARPGATLSTWCTARAVRDALAASGFVVERRPGFGAKREMLAARFAPRWKLRRHEPPLPYAGARQALVVGAGLAGCAASLALARRGWQVDVLEAAAREAGGASALPWGLLHPQLSVDDGVLARLTRAGFQLGRQWLARMPPGGEPLWLDSGVLQVARGEAEAWQMQQALAAFRGAPQFAEWVGRDEASLHAGVALRRGGVWFGTGGLVSSRRWCRAMLDAGAGRITLRAGTGVARIARGAEGWRAADARGATLAEAPVLVVAAALAAPALLGLRHAPVRPVRGRLSLLRAGDLATLRAGLAGDGYALRVPEGFAAVGASYEFEPEAGADWASDEDIHRGNLQRLARMLAVPADVSATAMFDGTRCVAHDRLPFAGAVADEDAALSDSDTLRGAHLADLPRCPGLMASFAFGSRGLALAPLAAELIAAQLEGEPWPLERDLAAALDPARFLLRRLRGGQPG